MEAAYYAVKSALEAERQRCTPYVVVPSSPRLSARQEVSESREEIVRTVQESHKQQVESYKVEVETTLKKLETALKTGRDLSIPLLPNSSVSFQQLKLFQSKNLSASPPSLEYPPTTLNGSSAWDG